MKCAKEPRGMAGRAIAQPEFNLVGQTVHYALPDILNKKNFLAIYLNMFTNVFKFYKVDHKTKFNY